MNWKEFKSKVEGKDVKPVYLFYGEEVYMIDYMTRLVKNQFIDERFESLNYVLLDGESVGLDNIIDACETLPFMGEKKLVIVKDFPYLERGGAKGEGIAAKDLKTLVRYVQELDSYVCLIFTVKGGDVIKSSELYKAIKSAGDVVEFGKLKGMDLNAWVENKFNSFNKVINRSNIQYFIQQSFYFDIKSQKTLYDLENEINKICNYRTGGREITKEDIDRVMSKSLEMNIFNLLNAISAKNGQEALRLFNELYIANNPALQILHMIVRQLRNMFSYKVLKEKGYSDKEVNSKMGLKEFEFKKVAQQSKNFTTDQLERALLHCLETDRSLKTSPMDERLALEILITNLCYKI